MSDYFYSLEMLAFCTDETHIYPHSLWLQTCGFAFCLSDEENQ